MLNDTDAHSAARPSWSARTRAQRRSRRPKPERQYINVPYKGRTRPKGLRGALGSAATVLVRAAELDAALRQMGAGEHYSGP